MLKIAKEKGLINSVREIIEEMKNESFCIEEELITALLESVGKI